MTFIEWMNKELKDGTFKDKQYYILACFCPEGIDGVFDILDVDRLDADFLAMRQRYESVYSEKYWDPEYVSYEECVRRDSECIV